MLRKTKHQVHKKAILSKTVRKFPGRSTRRSSLCLPSTENSHFKMEAPMGGLLSHLALAACAHKFAYAMPVYGSLMEHGAGAFCKRRVDNH
ncbi:hypothetical protein P7K49_029541, partial [Saguinus oedipus]